MTNKTSILSLIALSMTLTACGKYDKNPVGNLDQMREAGTKELVLGPDKPQVIREEVVVYVPKEVVREVERQVPTVVTQVVEQATVDEKYLVIAPDLNMNFVEGKSASFKVRARVLLPGAKINLTARNLPEGATLKDVSTANDPGLYELSWAAPLSTVPATSGHKVFTVKLVAQITETKDAADRKLLESLAREKEISLTVFRDQSPPSELVVTNLPNEVSEGSLTSFQVTVKVPGIDGSAAQKPTLQPIFDGVVAAAGQNYQESDGTRHLVADAGKADVEYVGNQTWKFNRVFDTKNIPAQPQLSKDGAVMANADGVRVRLSFKVYSPNGSSTAQVLKQIKIKYDRPVAAPRFDLSGIVGKDALELTPGESLRLHFYVESTDTRAAVKVQIPDLKGLVGSPSLECKDSTTGSFRQACTLRWAVPCSATEEQLKNEIKLSAQGTFSNTSSETASYALKTQKSKTAPNCAAPVAATPEVQK